jgi:hypothetical protein
MFLLGAGNILCFAGGFTVFYVCGKMRTSPEVVARSRVERLSSKIGGVNICEK